VLHPRAPRLSCRRERDSGLLNGFQNGFQQYEDALALEMLGLLVELNRSTMHGPL